MARDHGTQNISFVLDRIGLDRATAFISREQYTTQCALAGFGYRRYGRVSLSVLGLSIEYLPGGQ